jgi:hypothetical protein
VKRRVFNFAAALSLVMCVATVVLWVRGPRRSDYVSLVPRWRAFVGMTQPGAVKFASWPSPRDDVRSSVASYEYGVRNAEGAWINPPARAKGPLGFDLRPVRLGNRLEPRSFELILPFWFVTAALLTLPAVATTGFVRRRRLLAGNHCRSCGYDLRATAGRCPECGAEPQAAQPALPAHRHLG